MQKLSPASGAVIMAAAILALASIEPASAQQPAPDPTPRSSDWLYAPSPSPSAAGQVKSNIRYTLERSPTPSPEEEVAYAKITATMDKAVKFYNDYSTGLTKNLTVAYSPGTPTADGNGNGHLRFGKYTVSVVPTAMHEIMHAIGIGQAQEWQKLVVDGVFTGKHATAMLREITHDPQAVVHADHNHFWPYGLNYVTEVKSDQDLISHCRMVSAIRQDLNEAR